jgi:hypothetical protein
MASQINIDVYEFSTGMEFSNKYTQPFLREQIVTYSPASIYNFKNQHFTNVRSKITAKFGGVLEDYYVAQTVEQITTLLDA